MSAIGVTAVIVTHNPSENRFRLVLSSTAFQVGYVVIVDNASVNRGFIRGLCNEFGNCRFVEVGFNSGIAHAINIGIDYAMRHLSQEWFLLLDDDTILLNGAVEKALNAYQGLPSAVGGKVGIISLGAVNGDCNVREIRFGATSGSLVRADVFKLVRFRDDFFLDQADFDFYARVRRLGYLILKVDCKLIDHKLGRKRWVPIISSILGRAIDYEPPWRYYYIARNSTILLREGLLDPATYVHQLVNWGIRILLADGPTKFIKSLGLGLMHGLMREMGFLDKEYIK